MGIRSWNKQQEQVIKKLRNYRALVSKHKACKDLMNSLFPSTIQNITDTPKGGGEDLKMESLIDRRTNVRKQMEESLNELKIEIDEVIDLIRPLPPKEYTVVFRYYLLGEAMETVSANLIDCENKQKEISVRHCWRLHNRAISRLSEKCHCLAQ